MNPLRVAGAICRAILNCLMNRLWDQLWVLRNIPWQITFSAYLAIVLLFITIFESVPVFGRWLQFACIAYLLFLAFKISGILNERRRMGNMVYVMLTLLMNIRLAFGETAFDCAAPGIKVATYDLLNTAPCPEYQSIYRTKVMRRAQLLQRDASKLVDAVQCQLLVERENCYVNILFFKSSLPFLSGVGMLLLRFTSKPLI